MIITLALLIMLGFSDAPNPVQAAAGEMRRSIFVNPIPPCGYFSAGVAFDGSELLISCVFSNVITRVSPVDGRNIGSYTVNGIAASEGITAMSWDTKNGRLWVGSATVVPQRIYTVTLDRVGQRGIATFKFAHTQGGGESWVDGLAFDPTDGTVWLGPDGQTRVYHYTQAGTLLGSFSVAGLAPFGKSGLVVGSATKLYVANDGLSQIFSVNKDGSSPTFFARVPAGPFGKRVEDLECDNVTFAPKSVIWSKYSFDNYELNAWEVPAGECFIGSAPADKILDVPYFDQRAAPWGGLEYDFASRWAGQDVPDLCPGDGATCIARWGCALSSVTMLLRYHQIDRLPNCSENKCPELVGLEVNPGNLNEWLKKEPGGYKGNGYANWDAVATLSQRAGRPLAYSRGEGMLEQLRAQLDDEIKQGRPAIVDLSPNFQHFVVAKGILSSQSTFALNDPDLRYASDLRTYGNVFSSLRKYRHVGTDLSALLISIDPPTDFLVIDSQGRRAGFDPTTTSKVNEISGALYYTETALSDDGESGTTNGSGLRELHIENPLAGTYAVVVLGEEAQNYGITFYSYDQQANPQIVSDIRTSSVTNPPQYFITYDPIPGVSLTVELLTQIDIKPGETTNPINLKSKGVVPVAILSTETFDATTVDPLSVKFGSNGATESHGRGHIEDVNGDGKLDMMLHFLTQKTGIFAGDTLACLTGKTISEFNIQGCNLIQVVPPNG